MKSGTVALTMLILLAGCDQAQDLGDNVDSSIQLPDAESGDLRSLSSCDGMGSCLVGEMPVAPPVVYRFWGSSANDVWAVGKGALTMHWNGTSWRRSVNPATGDLWAVWGTASTDIWAVGDNATILHWDGTSWTAAAGPPIAGGYNDVWGATANDVWAVGDNGSIARWDGTKWSQLTTTYSNGFMAVWAAATDNVFIGGEAGLMLNWDGTKLNEVVTGIGDVIWRIRGTSAGSVYVTTSTGILLTWNGTRFITPGGGRGVELSVVSDRDVSLASLGGAGAYVTHWNGMSWSSTLSPSIMSKPTAIWSTSNDGWLCLSAGQLLRYDGKSWSLIW